MIERRLAIGPHTATTGRTEGLGDWLRRRAQVGGLHRVPVVVKCVNGTTGLMDAQGLRDEFGPGVGYAIFRRSHVGGENGVNRPEGRIEFDLPPYWMSPADACSIHTLIHEDHTPPELDMSWIIRETINEPRGTIGWEPNEEPVPGYDGRADWLGEVCYLTARHYLARGQRWAGPGFAMGNPEPEVWRTPGFMRFLDLASRNRGKIFVALHEYVGSPSRDLVGDRSLVGRFVDMYRACDEAGLAHRPDVLITEFGWAYDDVPGTSSGVDQIDRAWLQIYAPHPGVKGLLLWALDGSAQWQGLDQKVHSYMDPLTSLATSKIYTVEEAPRFPSNNGGTPPTTPDCVIPRIEFTKRTLLLSPKMGGDWAQVAARDLYALREDGTPWPNSRWEITNSADAAAIGPKLRRIFAVNPGDWAGGDASALRAWYAEHYKLGEGGLDLIEWFADTPEDLGRLIRAWIEAQEESFRFEVWPTDYQVVTQYFGENPEFYGQFGLPGHDGIDLRAPHGTPIYAGAPGSVYRVDLDPDAHNYGIHVRIRSGAYRHIYAHLSQALVQVGDVVAAGQMIGRSGNTGNSFGSHLHLGLKEDGSTSWPYELVDPLPHLIHLFEGEPGPGPGPDPEPEEPELVLLGLHDEAGGDWMRAQGLQGWSLHTLALGPNATRLHFGHFPVSGIRMLIRLNWGYTPQGNLPHPDDTADQDKFVAACVETMRTSEGIWGWIIGNECNNPAEFPNGNPLIPEYVARIYNRIYDQVSGSGLRISPPPIDPYFGPYDPEGVWVADNGEYFDRLWTRINGAQFVTIHTKTQQPDPALIESDALFSHPPLQWQFTNYRAYEPYLARLPERFRDLPVIHTESNPHPAWNLAQFRPWVEAARANLQAWNEKGGQQFLGALIYRWAGDSWGLSEHGGALDTLRDLMRGQVWEE